MAVLSLARSLVRSLARSLAHLLPVVPVVSLDEFGRFVLEEVAGNDELDPLPTEVAPANLLNVGDV